MGQPSGRVLSLPAKYRTYLRCSPIICAADSVSIFIHLVFYLTRFPFQDAIRLLLNERFGDEEKDPEGIQAIEKVTFARWLFFFFGTLGSGIKLMAMVGVPWTKTWGAMFLLLFIVVEGLVILTWIYKPYKPLPGSPDAGMIKSMRIEFKLGTIDDKLVNCSLFLHTSVLGWVIVDIYDSFSVLDPIGWRNIKSPPWNWPVPFLTLVLGLVVLVGRQAYPPMVLSLAILPVFIITFPAPSSDSVLSRYIFGNRFRGPSQRWPGKVGTGHGSPAAPFLFYRWSAKDGNTRWFGVKINKRILGYFLIFFLVLVICVIHPTPWKELIVIPLFTWGFSLVLAFPSLIVLGFLRMFAESWPMFRVICLLRGRARRTGRGRKWIWAIAYWIRRSWFLSCSYTRQS